MDVNGVVYGSWGLALVDSCPAEKDEHYGEILIAQPFLSFSLMLMQSPFPSSSHTLSLSLERGVTSEQIT